MLRNIASRLTKIALASAMGAETARNVSAFRVFRTRLREGFQDYRSPSVSIDVLLTWSTTRFTAIKVRHAPRAAGTSGYTVGKLIRHAVDLMTGFSTLPLQIASVIGFVFVIFGVSILILVLINYLIRGAEVPGFTFLASMIAIFSGAQLFALGIFGEYLARMHFRSMDRPTYVIGETVASSDRRTIRTWSGRYRRTEMFSFVEERFDSPALDLTYYLAPWDVRYSRAILPPFFDLVRTELAAAAAFETFRDWCVHNRWNWSVADCLRTGWSNAGSSKRRAFASWS